MNKNLNKLEKVLGLVEEVQVDLINYNEEYIEQVDDMLSMVYEQVLNIQKYIKLNR